MSRRIHPVVVVGCGPAGLAAAHALQGRCLVLEAGSAVRARRRDHPRDIVSGVGGAGLYSDGKFSFYPSATGLWSLADEPVLRDAYGWVRQVLESHGIDAPAFPSDRRGHPTPTGFKPYPCSSSDLATRYALIERLYGRVADQVQLESRLEALTFNGSFFELAVRTRAGLQTVRARRLIGAGGRFFPLLLRRELTSLPRVFRRLELGVRIQGPAEHPLFARLMSEGRSPDPKLILREGQLEWRTFCCCLQGEVVETRASGLTSLSGRSDCPPTGRSNIGFNVRFLAPRSARAVDLDRVGRHGPFRLPLSTVLANPESLRACLGHPAADALHRGLQRLPQLQDAESLELLGPTIEGVGEYPAIDSALHSPSLPVHVAGDAGGTFRGIVAALVSGRYAGRQAARLLEPRRVVRI